MLLCYSYSYINFCAQQFVKLSNLYITAKHHLLLSSMATPIWEEVRWWAKKILGDWAHPGSPHAQNYNEYICAFICLPLETPTDDSLKNYKLPSSLLASALNTSQHNQHSSQPMILYKMEEQHQSHDRYSTTEMRNQKMFLKEMCLLIWHQVVFPITDVHVLRLINKLWFVGISNKRII